MFSVVAANTGKQLPAVEQPKEDLDGFVDPILAQVKALYSNWPFPA
ncbi:hypothetical protein L0222_19715 [bacterium]|nr:hypothetical protein [bacterium]